MRRIVSVLALLLSPTIAGAQYAQQSIGLAPVGSTYSVGQSFSPLGGLGTCGNTGAALGTVGYGTCGTASQAIVQQSFVPQQAIVQEYVQAPMVVQQAPIVVRQPVYVSRGLGVGYGINRGHGLNRGFGVGSGYGIQQQAVIPGYGVGVGNGIGLAPVGVGRGRGFGLFGGRRGRTVIRQRQVIRSR